MPRSWFHGCGAFVDSDWVHPQSWFGSLRLQMFDGSFLLQRNLDVGYQLVDIVPGCLSMLSTICEKVCSAQERTLQGVSFDKGFVK